MHKVSPNVEIHLSAEEAAYLRRYLYCVRTAGHNYYSGARPTQSEFDAAAELEKML